MGKEVGLHSEHGERRNKASAKTNNGLAKQKSSFTSEKEKVSGAGINNADNSAFNSK